MTVNPGSQVDGYNVETKPERDWWLYAKDPNGVTLSDKNKSLQIETLLSFGAFAGLVKTVTASGDIDLEDTDYMQVEIDPDGSDRDVNLPVKADTNHWYLIRHVGSANTLNIKRDGGVSIGTIGAGGIMQVEPSTANDFSTTLPGQDRFLKGADVASASALPVLNDGNYCDVTGTTAITSINTLGVGTTRRLHFDGILTLTHHATDLILPGGANITTAAGDEFTFFEYATGDWRCIAYALASGEAVVGGGVGSGSLPTAQVKKTANQSIANSTVTTLTWDAEDWDTDSFHDNSTNNSRLTAPEDGKYLVIANIIFASNNTGIRQILINLNGANVWGVIFPNNGAGEDQTFTFFPVEMSSGDYVECQVYQASGGNLDIGSTQSRFSIVKLAN